MLWRNPAYLWLLAGIAGLALGLAILARRRAAGLVAFAEAPLVARLAPDVDRRRRAVRTGLRLAALACVGVALAGPKWGFHWEEVRREGIDLIVAIDTSRSMLATDVKPNRLERAKLAVLDLVRLLAGDRIGLVAFAGTAFLECPLTLDYAAFEQTLRALEVGIIPRGGTALGVAIDTSLAGFEARQGKHEALILITDGEDNEGGAEEAAKRAAERGVKIYTVGIGTSEGELIPLGAEGYVKDRSGQVVKSRLDEETLQKIAAASSGAYVRGLGPALGLDEVFRDHIAKMEKREVTSGLERKYEERFQWPLGAALLLLLVEAVVGDRRAAARQRAGVRRWAWLRARRPLPSRGQPGPAAAVLLLGLAPALLGWFDPPGDRATEGNRLYAAGKYAEAAEKYREGLVDAPESPLLQFNLGTALYKQGQYADATAAWSKVLASGEAAWIARAAYNVGNAHYRLGANAEASEPQAAIASYEQALGAYKRAMGADPRDLDAKRNHEFVAGKLAELKKKLEEQQKQQEQQQQEQQQQEQQQQEQPPPEQGQSEPQPEQGTGEGREEGEPEQQQAPGEQQQEQAQADQPPDDGQRATDDGQQEAAAGGAETEVGEQAESVDQQAAQAVIDTARGEELSPDEIDRAVGVAGDIAPAQDW